METRYKKFTISMPPYEVNQINRLAEAQKRTRSNMILVAWQEYWEKKKNVVLRKAK